MLHQTNISNKLILVIFSLWRDMEYWLTGPVHNSVCLFVYFKTYFIKAKRFFICLWFFRLKRLHIAMSWCSTALLHTNIHIITFFTHDALCCCTITVRMITRKQYLNVKKISEICDPFLATRPTLESKQKN